MSALRDEIRAILREEIAALRHEMAPARAPETVHVASSADLNRFARDLLARAAQDAGFADAVRSGAQRFELAGGHHPANQPAPRLVTSPTAPAPRALVAEITKPLLTERDIDALDGDARVVRVPKTCRLTPLAHDEARRRGIRIERFAT